MPGAVAVKQLRIFQFDHRRAGTRRRDDEPVARECLDRIACHRAGIIVIAAVEVRLSAARLRLGKIDVDPKTPQQFHGVHTDIWKKRVSQTSNHERNVQASAFSYWTDITAAGDSLFPSPHKQNES